MFDSEIQERLLSLIESVTEGVTGSNPTQGGDAVEPAQVVALSESMQALLQTTITKASGLPSSVAQTAGSTLSSLAKSLFGLAPLATGISKLFGGGDTPPSQPLIEYSWPSPVQLEATTLGDGSFGTIDYGQGDLPRLIGQATAMRGSGAAWEAAPTIWQEASRSGPAEAAASATYVSGETASERQDPLRVGYPQVTVQVQAMDSRSFLEHSDEIARAVREAILNSHAINDAVQEL